MWRIALRDPDQFVMSPTAQTAWLIQNLERIVAFVQSHRHEWEVEDNPPTRTTTDDWSPRRFALASTRDVGGEDLPLLMRRLAEEIQQRSIQPENALDLIAIQHETESDSCWSITLYERMDDDAAPFVYDDVRWESTHALVADWWSYYDANGGFAEGAHARDTTPREDAADEIVDELSQQGDPRAVPLLVALAEAAPSRKSLFYLGAGPLEDLVHGHGDALAPLLVARAAACPRFKIALSGVWLDEEQPLQTRTVKLLEPFLGDDNGTPFERVKHGSHSVTTGRFPTGCPAPRLAATVPWRDI